MTWIGPFFLEKYIYMLVADLLIEAGILPIAGPRLDSLECVTDLDQPFIFFWGGGIKRKFSPTSPYVTPRASVRSH